MGVKNQIGQEAHHVLSFKRNIPSIKIHFKSRKISKGAAVLCVGHSTISSGHLLPVKNQSFGEWQFRVFESKLQYFFGSAES